MKMDDLFDISHEQQDTGEIALSTRQKTDLTKLRGPTKKDMGSPAIPSTCPVPKDETTKYREGLREKFQLMREKNFHPGEHELLYHQFTSLQLLMQYHYKEQKQHEVLVQRWEHTKFMQIRGRLTKVSALFDPVQYTGTQPHTVVLQGAAGVGKTTLAIKVMLDWAEGKLYQERFDYVFYLSCRKLNPLERREISFADLIANDWPHPPVSMTEIMSKPERLLFIIDGLDELKFPCNEHRYDLCKDWKEQRPVPVLLISLLRKTLLPEAFLLLTTRLTALGKFIPLLENPHHVEVLGFSVGQRKKYFYKFFRNEDLGNKAFKLVNDNGTLFTMCSVPLINWIVCTCLKQQEERGRDPIQALKTTTALYMCYIDLIIPDDHKFIRQHLRSLCGLAAEGIWERKLLFEEEDLRRHHLKPADVSAFLDMSIFQKDSDCEKCYSFIHLSFQEFFAAMFYLMSTDKEGGKSPDSSIPDVKKLLEECGRNEASFVVLVVHFLFGFLNAETAKELEKKFRCTMSQEIRSQLLQWVEGEVIRNYEKYLSFKTVFPEFYSHLYETQDAIFVTKALVKIKEIEVLFRYQYEALIAAFCIKHCSGAQRILFSSYCLNFVLPAGVGKDLSSVINKNQNLKELQLVNISLPDSYIEKLCVKLRDPNCKLEKLTLEHIKITSSACQHLFSSLNINESLKYLHLLRILLKDDGKQHHNFGEKMNSQLETIRIIDCQRFSVFATNFFFPLGTSKRMKTLDLSFTHLEEGEVNILCYFLAKEECGLQTLSLQHCNLTPTCFQDLFSALSSKESLKDLDLSGNFFEEGAIKLLCKALENQNCKLEKLSLRHCNLTHTCFQNLFSALSSNGSLKDLDLIGNSFKEGEIKLLHKALKNQNPNLEKLRKNIKKIPEGYMKEEECCNSLQEHRMSTWGNERPSEDRPSSPYREGAPQTKPEVTSSLSAFDYLKDKQLDVERCYNTFLGPNGPVQLDLIENRRNLYRVHLPMAGFYHWPDTGLGFSVRRKVTVYIEFGIWNQHLDWNQEHNWMIAGPLFHIRVEPGVVTFVHLPHFVSLQGRNVDVSLFKIAHFKEEGMVLENPTRVETFHAVLENPSFSPMGVLKRIVRSNFKVSIRSTTLIYCQLRSEDITLHLYLIPSDCSIKKAIDEEEAKFHFLRLHKPSPVTPLRLGSRFLVYGSKHLEIMPAELELCYQNPGECQLFSEIYSNNVKERINLELRHPDGTQVWATMVRVGDLEYACSHAPSASAPTGLHFVDQHRDQIISRVTSVDTILDRLYNTFLSNEDYEHIRAEKTNPDKMRRLFSLSMSWDRNYKDYLYEVLKETHPHLMNEIENT